MQTLKSLAFFRRFTYSGPAFSLCKQRRHLFFPAGRAVVQPEQRACQLSLAHWWPSLGGAAAGAAAAAAGGDQQEEPQTHREAGRGAVRHGMLTQHILYIMFSMVCLLNTYM